MKLRRTEIHDFKRVTKRRPNDFKFNVRRVKKININLPLGDAGCGILTMVINLERHLTWVSNWGTLDGSLEVTKAISCRGT